MTVIKTSHAGGIRSQVKAVFETPLFAVHQSLGSGVKGWSVTHIASGFAVMTKIPTKRKAASLARFCQKTFVELEIPEFTDGRNVGRAAGKNWVELKERINRKKKEIAQ